VVDSAGRGPQVQQLQVRGTHPRLAGPQGMDQSQRCELHNTIGAEGCPGGRQGAFPEIAWEDLKVSQAEGLMDMIIGRDNPEWMPFPMKEEPYEWFTLMRMSLSSGYILQENERAYRMA
jgi:hypothetical protein